eukprot:2969476-Rhodomonas_salina.1
MSSSLGVWRRNRALGRHMRCPGVPARRSRGSGSGRKFGRGRGRGRGRGSKERGEQTITGRREDQGGDL